MLDLRLPIGAYFVINSIILVVAGLINPGEIQVAEKNLNLNLVWGLVMGAFGIFMLVLWSTEKNKNSAKSKVQE
ncbi:MAG: hypothetical protein K2X27_05140 [Candidatus Obscuribacterales bacterium]|nr:hypothetical protein [Candidatus Obscuribacterales bacterium]